MNHGNTNDYAHPFADRTNRETDTEAVERVVSIGIAALLAWWGRVKDDTHPGSYGASRSELAGSVAHMAAGGKVARRFADESEPRFEAARQLGVGINWT